MPVRSAKGISLEFLRHPIAIRRLVTIFVCAALICAARNESAKAPLQSIGSVLNPLDTAGLNQATLRGVVTLVRKHVLFVQDQTGALPVYAADLTEFAIGDEVELQGALHHQGAASSITADSIRRLWSGSAPVPASLTPEQAAEGSFNNWLIDTEGRLLKKIIADGYLRLTFEGNGQLFGATLELSSPLQGSTRFAKELDEGSLLRIVGVCSATPNVEQSLGSAFVVLLRSTDDVRVLRAAPWWNVRHAVWLGCLSLALVSILYWLRQRALNLRFLAIVEERSRIAREMHDTLAQGFSGLTYQLEGLEKELAASVEKRSIERHLGLALQLVRHCREEAHRSIFALRSLTQSQPDLLALLRSSFDNQQNDSAIRFVTVTEGKPMPIPDQVLNHLLRIGQEAITNAVRHSEANEIVASLIFRDHHATLHISDDGRGFDPEAPYIGSLGHFGLMGMRERAKHLRTDLNIRSVPGQGTMVSVTARLTPTPSHLNIWKLGA